MKKAAHFTIVLLCAYLFTLPCYALENNPMMATLIKQKARQELTSEEYQKFCVELETLLEKPTNTLEFRYKIGFLYYKVKEQEKSLHYLSSLPKESIYYTSAQMILADIYQFQKKNHLTEQAYLNVISQSLEKSDAQYKLLTFYMDIHYFEHALKLLSKLKKENPESDYIHQLIAFCKKKRKKGTLSVNYNQINTKPGYLLFSNDSSDYLSNSNTFGISYPLGDTSGISVDYTNITVKENDSNSANPKKLSLGYKFSTNPDTEFDISYILQELHSEKNLSDFSLVFMKNIEGSKIGVNLSSLHHAYDLKTILSPVSYYSLEGFYNYQYSQEWYFSLRPTLSYYQDDENIQQEIDGLISFSPEQFPDLVLNLRYETASFSRQKTDSLEDFLYFSPKSTTNIGINMNYYISLGQSSLLNLSCGTSRIEYSFDSTNITQYFSGNAGVGLSFGLTNSIKWNSDYLFSISQSDGYPATHDFNTELKIFF